MKKVLISVMGPDRPGIIAAVSRMLYELDCNIENVSQTTLQSQFGGIFLASIPGQLSDSEILQKLNTGLDPLRLHAHVQYLEEAEIERQMIESEPFVITTKGPDRKGLVARITEILARYGVNVTNLQAVFKGGKDPGDNIMIYEVDVPLEIDHSALYRDLRKRSEELDLDISIQHRQIFEALNRI
ncbi:glycine cleavage system protein R [Thermodesulfobacteriota bacterium]